MSNIPLAALQGITHFHEDNISNLLEVNLKIYYDWQLLTIGAWNEVRVDNSGIYGDYSKLRPVKDRYFNEGEVWESSRKDWVWETGVNYTDRTGTVNDPLQTGSLTINGAAASNAMFVNYPLGRVIFDTAVAITGTVQINRSERLVQILRADDAPWWSELQYGSYQIDEQFLTYASGEWSIGGHQRIQMPCIIIEVVPKGSTEGWELGGGAQIVSRDVLFHVLAEDRFTRNNLMDIINLQGDRSIHLFDSNTLSLNGDYALDFRGARTGSKMYPDLIQPSDEGGYRYEPCRMVNSIVLQSRQLHPRLYEATVRTTMEIIF